MWKNRWSSKPIPMTGYTKSTTWLWVHPEIVTQQAPQPLAFPRRCPLHPRRLRQVCTFVLSDCFTAAERVWDLSGIFMGSTKQLRSVMLRLVPTKNVLVVFWGYRSSHPIEHRTVLFTRFLGIWPNCGFSSWAKTVQLKPLQRQLQSQQRLGLRSKPQVCCLSKTSLFFFHSLSERTSRLLEPQKIIPLGFKLCATIENLIFTTRTNLNWG